MTYRIPKETKILWNSQLGVWEGFRNQSDEVAEIDSQILKILFNIIRRNQSNLEIIQTFKEAQLLEAASDVWADCQKKMIQRYSEKFEAIHHRILYMSHKSLIVHAIDSNRVWKIVKPSADSEIQEEDMNYLEGRRLDHALSTDVLKMSETQIRDLTLSLVDQVASAHSNGVVHGDIHPGNFLIQGTRAHLIDFELSFSEADSRAVAISGSPDFAAPEILAKASASRASDVYALAKTILSVFRASETKPPIRFDLFLAFAPDLRPSVQTMRALLQQQI